MMMTGIIAVIIVGVIGIMIIGHLRRHHSGRVRVILLRLLRMEDRIDRHSGRDQAILHLPMEGRIGHHLMRMGDFRRQ